MGNEWTTLNERARESDAHVAALLTSALIARTTHPSGTSAVMEAANAVNLYRCVLASLATEERDRAGQSVSPTMDSAAMQLFDVSRDGAKFRYRTYLYDTLDDALSDARNDRERQFEQA